MILDPFRLRNSDHVNLANQNEARNDNEADLSNSIALEMNTKWGEVEHQLRSNTGVL